jgi:hypothetical protein
MKFKFSVLGLPGIDFRIAHIFCILEVCFHNVTKRPSNQQTRLESGFENAPAALRRIRQTLVGVLIRLYGQGGLRSACATVVAAGWCGDGQSRWA